MVRRAGLKPALQRGDGRGLWEVVAPTEFESVFAA